MNHKKKNMLYPDSKNGIYLYEYPMINGIRQYVQVRGSSKNNPLLLFLHGGPGNSLAGLCHVLQAGWEKHFTVVNWDQRNACKTYLANKANAKAISQTGTMENFVQDIDEVIAYLHTVYDFEKLILMGFSWGSAIGAEYAKRHPENLLCYVSAGQHINYKDGFTCICKRMLEAAEKTPDSRDAAKIREMLDKFPDKPQWNKEFLQNIRSFPALTGKYIAKHIRRVPPNAVLGSPFLNCREKVSMMISNYQLLERAYATMMEYDFRQNMHFDVPVMFVFGEEETICPASLLETCYDDVSAPMKKLVIIPKASHICFYDQPEAFDEALSGFLNELQ